MTQHSKRFAPLSINRFENERSIRLNGRLCEFHMTRETHKEWQAFINKVLTNRLTQPRLKRGISWRSFRARKAAGEAKIKLKNIKNNVICPRIRYLPRKNS